MKVSHNELKSLLKQFFEAYGLPQGVYDAAAEAVVWSEAHGFNGLSVLQNSMDTLKPMESTIVKRGQSSDSFIELDVNSSAALWGRAVVGLGVVKSLSSGECEVSINGGFDHRLMLKELADAGTKKLYVRGSWVDDGKRMIASIDPTERYINYAEYDSANQIDSSSAILHFSKSKLPKHLEKPLASWSPTQSAQAYLVSLNQGMYISKELWARLGVEASRVLVESTEQSRHGAGA
jgi:hypothetical protein